jgi:hypothetical protein
MQKERTKHFQFDTDTHAGTGYSQDGVRLPANDGLDHLSSADSPPLGIP